ARQAFPEAWRVALCIPPWGRGLHGIAETRAFAQVAQGRTEELCRLVLLGMLPALAEADGDAFGEAVYEFNRRVGEGFRPVQGGTYADPRTADLVAFLRRQGVRGVGQSSWGPTVFAVLSDAERADWLATQIRDDWRLQAADVVVACGSNHGALRIDRQVKPQGSTP